MIPETRLAPLPESVDLPLVRRGWRMGRDDQALVKELEKPRPGVFLAWTCLHLAVWGAGVYGTHALQGWGVGLLLSLLLGSQLHALTVLQHDCGHGSAFASERWNVRFGRFLALFIVLPYTSFREAHKRHHWYLGEPGRDPDEWFYAGGTGRLWFREMIFLPHFLFLSLTEFGPKVRRTAAIELAMNSVLWALLLAALLQAGLFRVAAFGLLGPMLWLALVINPISRGFEHLPLARLPKGHASRKDIHQNTVTVTHPLIGLLWANINFHVEHHLFPRAPFTALPAIHRLLKRNNAFLLATFPLAPLGTSASKAGGDLRMGAGAKETT